ncbi:MAG: universal stress protein [Gammaproteobacteria bacterium]|nr:universal stress protein [Gammaproteobacteria bacterium]
MSKILVPTDGSEHAALAAAWAARHFHAPEDSITLLHVDDISTAEVMTLARLSRDEVQAVVQRHSQASIDKAREAMGSHGAKAKTSAMIGNAADTIIDVARHEEYDHIVMGSRGLSSLSGLLLGSVSEKVLRRAPCAVTIIRERS